MKKSFNYLGYFLIFLIGTNLYSQEQTVGLFKNDSLSFNGYTLFSPMAYNSTYLIDNCGQKINEWTFDSTPGLLAYLMDNGNLVRSGRVQSGFGAGGSGGKVEIKSWDDELLWTFTYANDEVKLHHDIEVMPNGNILMIAWEKRTFEETIAVGRDPESLMNDGLWFEQIIEVKPIGTDSFDIVWEWHLYDHVTQDYDSSLPNFADVSKDIGKLNINYKNFSPNDPTRPGPNDWIHLNSIDYHEELDQIVISSRNTHEIYVIDHSTNNTEAANSLGGKYGKGGDFLFRWGNNEAYKKGSIDDQLLYSQHDARWVRSNDINDARISIFNNGLNRPSGFVSSVEIINPDHKAGIYSTNVDGVFSLQKERITILDSDEIGFTSSRLSSAEVLDNNNTLISNGNGGTIVELDKDNNLVWRYVCPIGNMGPVLQGGNVSTNDVFRAFRYAPSFKGFNDKDLKPLGPIELNPFNDPCIIYSETTPVEEITFNDLKIYPNPSSNFITIESEGLESLRFVLSDITGKVLKTKKNTFSTNFDISIYPSGIYFVTVSNVYTSKVFKIIKL